MSPRAGLDRAAVLAAAARLANEQGLEALSLAELARGLGIRTPSLYNHVDGLPGLRRALALHGLAEMEQRLGRAAIGKSGAQAVTALVGAYRDFILEQPGVYAATVRSPLVDSPVDPELEAASREVVGIALAALAGYALNEADALHAVRILRSLVHGFASLEIAGGFGLALDVEESFRRLVAMYIAGLESGQISTR